MPRDLAGAQRRRRSVSFCQTHGFARLDLTHPPVGLTPTIPVPFPASFAATLVDSLGS